ARGLVPVGVHGTGGGVVAIFQVVGIDDESPRQPENREDVSPRGKRLRRLAVQAYEREPGPPGAVPALVVACLGSHHHSNARTDPNFRRPRPTCDRSDPERRSTAASPLDVGILEVEARRHELVLEIEDGAVQVEKALPVDHQLRSAVLEDLVALAGLIEIHLVGEPRAAAPDDLHAQAAVGDPLLGHQLLDLLRGLVGHSDHSTFLATFLATFPALVPPAFLTRPSCPTPAP